MVSICFHHLHIFLCCIFISQDCRGTQESGERQCSAIELSHGEPRAVNHEPLRLVRGHNQHRTHVRIWGFAKLGVPIDHLIGLSIINPPFRGSPIHKTRVRMNLHFMAEPSEPQAVCWRRAPASLRNGHCYAAVAVSMSLGPQPFFLDRKRRKWLG